MQCSISVKKKTTLTMNSLYGIILFTELNFILAIAETQDPNWCPAKSRDLDYTLNSYHVLQWGKQGDFARTIEECVWKIRLNNAHRIRFDITGLRLYNFRCYPSYETGTADCSDSVTLSYDDCSSAKKIITYQGDNNKPASFIGYTDTLCFHFTPNRNSSLFGSMYRREFYIRVGINVLSKYCLINEQAGYSQCVGICNADGTNVSNCQGKNLGGPPSSSFPTTVMTKPEVLFTIQDGKGNSSQLNFITQETLSSSYPPEEKSTVSSSHILTSAKVTSSVSHEPLTNFYRSGLESTYPLEVSPTSSDNRTNTNEYRTPEHDFSKSTEVTSVPLTSSLVYKAVAVESSVSNSFFTDSVKESVDRLPTSPVVPIETVQVPSATPTLRVYSTKVSKDHSSYGQLTTSFAETTSNSFTSERNIQSSMITTSRSSNPTTNPSYTVHPSTSYPSETFGEVANSFQQDTTTVYTRTRSVTYSTHVVKPTSVSMTTQRNGADKKQTDVGNRSMNENVMIIVTSCAGTVFFVGLLFVLGCFIRRHKRGEGSFETSVENLYHQSDDPLWKENWTVNRSFNDMWTVSKSQPDPSEKPSLPRREKPSSPSQHSKLSRKRTLSASDESTDHECGFYDNVIGMTTKEYISSLNGEDSERQTNHVHNQNTTPETDKMYSHVQK